MRKIKKLLELCHETWPVAKPRRHACSINDDGKFGLSIACEKVFECFTFLDEDLDKEPDEIISEMKEVWAKRIKNDKWKPGENRDRIPSSQHRSPRLVHVTISNDSPYPAKTFWGEQGKDGEIYDTDLGGDVLDAVDNQISASCNSGTVSVGCDFYEFMVVRE